MAIVGEIIRAVLHYSSPGASEQLNVFHYVVEANADTDIEQANALNAHFTNDWAPAWADLAAMDSEITQLDIDIVNVDGTVSRNVTSFAIAVGGALAGDITSAAVAAYLLLNTILPKVRGSKYIPGLSNVNIIAGEFRAQALVDLLILLSSYAEIVVTSGASLLTPGVPASSTLAFEEFVTTGAIESIPAYQRRRKPNVGS